MSRIHNTFTKLDESKRTALIPCLVAGDPDLETTLEAARELAERGADILELIVPFSDPMADGPTIQAASQRALAGGVNLKAILDAVTELRQQIELPIVMMTYLNPVFRMGMSEFGRQAKKAGVDGVILPELPVEEAPPWSRVAEDAGLDTIFLASPTSGPERLAEICKASTGFVYAVTLTGTTGARESLPEELIQNLTRLRMMSPKPVAAGFGISGPEAVRRLAPHADGLIIGSALVKMMEEGSKNEKIRRLGEAVTELKAAIEMA
ncbi:MAG: tryptophan synthase subunit alpha [Deltaproteobacteria bacterium]|nr:tryptophan synthase subunit alpha [Deltaproteobacteria bacterium]MBW2141101.1 tryptophan synthase subunit alpha [Deltaproteobacteria bacterium]